MAGIIFIGKEIDDKLANEVIGVLPLPQLLVQLSSLNWTSNHARVLGCWGTLGWGILRLYLDSDAGLID